MGKYGLAVLDKKMGLNERTGFNTPDGGFHHETSSTVYFISISPINLGAGQQYRYGQGVNTGVPDPEVYASIHTNPLGQYNSNIDLRAGQYFEGGWLGVFRGMVYFETSSLIPVGATILFSTLYLYLNNLNNSVENFDVHILDGISLVEPRNNLTNYGLMLPLITPIGTINSADLILNSYNGFPLSSGIVGGQDTKFAVRSSREIDAIVPTRWEAFTFSGSLGPPYPVRLPYLEVTYEI